MTKLFPVLKNTATGCGTCGTSACTSCSPANQKTSTSPAFTRRDAARAALGATAVILSGGSIQKAAAQEESASAPSEVSPELAVVQKSKGPVMTMIDEFFKMGPGPSSSHTMGPMRITYDFYQRVSKLPDEQLKRATAIKVHLFGSLSATGKGHGTDRAALAGLLGKAPATCPPQFLDGLAANPDQTYKVTLGPKTLDLSLKDIIFDATKGDFHHPNTMT